MYSFFALLACSLATGGQASRVHMAWLSKWSIQRKHRTAAGISGSAAKFGQLQQKHRLGSKTLQKLLLLPESKPAIGWQFAGARRARKSLWSHLAATPTRASSDVAMMGSPSSNDKSHTTRRSSATTSSIMAFDSQKNPTLARIAHDKSFPEYEEGRHFRTVCLESGSERMDLPILTTSPGVVELDETGKPPVSHVDVKSVPGGIVLENVLTARECDQIIKISETFGYTEDAPVSLGRHIRQNENCVWIADDELCDGLFRRCMGALPSEVQSGEVCGLNARWRLYKYNPSDVFKPHTDGSWPGSGLDSSGKLIQDRYGDRWSQMSLVLYLNDDFEGGATRFLLPTGTQNEYQVENVKAACGGAVCFFHGEHPLSPLHEGGLVTAGTKYIIRTDVLYKLPPARATSPKNVPFTKEMLVEMAKVATPEQRQKIEEVLRALQENADES